MFVVAMLRQHVTIITRSIVILFYRFLTSWWPYNSTSQLNYQLRLFGYIVFHEVQESKTCRKSFTNILMLLSEMYDLNEKRNPGVIFSSILFDNSSKLFTLKSTVAKVNVALIGFKKNWFFYCIYLILYIFSMLWYLES